MFKKIMLSLCCLFFTAPLFAASSAHQWLNEANTITVKEATVKLAKMGPLGQKTSQAREVSTEAKMDIINDSAISAKLIAVTSDIARKVQLHHFISKNGKRIMAQTNGIEVKPRSKDDLSYRGVHIMLIGLKKPLAQNQKIPLTLIFADGSYLHVVATVKS